MPFKQNYSAPDPLKSLLPCGEGLYDSYQKLLFIWHLMDIKDESESKKMFASYVSINWPRIVNDIYATDHSKALVPGGSGCSPHRVCFPCKAHCWTGCLTNCVSSQLSGINSVIPVGGGISKEILQLINTSKKVAGIISRNRYELGKNDALAVLKNFRSVRVPKDQGIPLIETTIFSFAKGAIEHKDKNGWDVLKFTSDNFFASYNAKSVKYSDIMSIEICTAIPWFVGYCEAIANVKVEYSFPKRRGAPFTLKLKQM